MNAVANRVPILLSLALGVVFTLPVLASAQVIDPTFNPNIPLGTFDGIDRVALQPDGKVLIGVRGNARPAASRRPTYLYRVLPDGSPDASFTAVITGTYPQYMSFSAIVVQPDGRILLAGSWGSVNGVSDPAEGGVIRLNADGSTDSSFAQVAGRVPSSLALQHDGKVLVGRDRLRVNNTDGTELVRVLANGAPDPSFTVSIDGGVASFAVQPDGRVLVGGDFTTVNSVARQSLMRLETSGLPDPAFAPTRLPVNSNVLSIAVRPSGHVLFASRDVGGRAGPAGLEGVYQLLASGATDTSFNIPATANGPVDAVALLPDGRALVAGAFSTWGALRAQLVVRLDPQGIHDPGFIPYPTSSGSYNRIWSIAVQPDGAAIVGGPDAPLNRLLYTAPTSQAPGPPTLTGVNVDSNPVAFSWAPGGGGAPTMYVLHAGTSSGASDLGVFPMGAATSISATAPSGIRIFVRVVASNGHGSATSNEVAFQIGGGGLPAAPTLTATQAATNPVVLSWTAGVGGAAPQSYTLVAGTASGASNLGTFPMGLATSISAAAPTGVPLFIRVVAIAAAGSAVSNEISFTVQAPSVPPPPAMNAAVVSGNTVQLSWSTSAGSSYLVLARIASGGPVVASLPVGAGALTVPGVPPGTYFVSVVATRGGLTSAESNTVVVTVP